MTMTTKPSLIFFGNEQLAQGIRPTTPIFDALLAHGFPICALVLPDARRRQPYPIALRAMAENIPVHYVATTAEISELIKKYQPNTGVLASFGKIIPQSLLDAIPNGILNIHPSLLPKYRGTTPIESALLNGDTETGVSIIRLTAKMDAGPILAQANQRITPETTKQTLYEQLAQLGAKLLISVLNGETPTKNAPERPQDDARATFTEKLDKDQSVIKNAEKPASELAREVVAFAGFPRSRTVLLAKNCIITQAHAADQPTTELDLRCADGRYLVIDRLIPENSKEMDAKSFLNGFKK